MRRLFSFLLVCTLVIPATIGAAARGDASISAYFGALQWRSIGPFRGGRALAVAGVPGRDRITSTSARSTAACGRARNAGRTWNPIFDRQDIGSIGAIAVAPSDPRMIYVGTGEADMRSDIAYGDGVYKSTDGGKSWAHVGLSDTRQIGAIVVDPRNANVAYVARARTCLRSQRRARRLQDDRRRQRPGARCSTKTTNTGAISLAMEPGDPDVDLCGAVADAPSAVERLSALERSGQRTLQVQRRRRDVDAAHERLARARRPHRPVDLARRAAPRLRQRRQRPRLGRRLSLRRRRGDVDAPRPRAAHLAARLVLQRNHRRSARSQRRLRDEHRDVSLDRRRREFRRDSRRPDGRRLSRAVDRSERFEPHDTRQRSRRHHHDRRRDERGARGTTSRRRSSITSSPITRFRTGSTARSKIPAPPWRRARANTERSRSKIFGRSTSAVRTATLAPDPRHPGVVYGDSSGQGGPTVTREIPATGWEENLDPVLDASGNGLAQHLDAAADVLAGRSYLAVLRAPERLPLARRRRDLADRQPGSLARQRRDAVESRRADARRHQRRAPPRRRLYDRAVAAAARSLVWAGTDDGYIWVTRDDARTWHNVTPPALAAWSKVGIIEASHFDTNVAYAAIDRHRLDDYAPYIYRTRDGGATWSSIASGIPSGSFVNVVREDPVRRGLLYAGTEKGIYVSFDDGAAWQSLQRNLPVTSIRDIAVHGDDLVVATHGRAFWVMDDITPLRQMSEALASSDVLPLRARSGVPRAAGQRGRHTASARRAASRITRLWACTSTTISRARRARRSSSRSSTTAAASFDAGRARSRRSRRIRSRSPYTPHWIARHPVPAGNDRRAPLRLGLPPRRSGRAARAARRVHGSAQRERQCVHARSAMLLRDPRIRATIADLRAQYELARQVGGAARGGRGSADARRGASQRAIRCDPRGVSPRRRRRGSTG